MKGIILVKDIALAEAVAKTFGDWLVATSPNIKEEVEYYPVPTN